jgi:hypothetical protein
MPLLIKVIVDLSVDRAELLQRLRASKPQHRSFSSSKWLVRVLRPIVAAATDLVPIGGDSDLVHRRRVRPKPVGDDAARSAVFPSGPA